MKAQAIEEGRESAPASRRIKRAKILLGVLLLAVLFTSSFWGPKALRHLAFFRVRKVEIQGARYASPADLLDRLHVDTSRSVWDPLPPLAERIRSHPQVESVTVTRKLPGTLVVQVLERRPVALVPTSDGLRAVDQHGRRLPLDPSRTPVDAPIVTAASGDTSVWRLLGAMQRDAPRLYGRLSTIRRAGAGEMLLGLADLPVRVLTSVTLARLSDIEPVERDLARRQLRPVELDLRYRDQVIARLP